MPVVAAIPLIVGAVGGTAAVAAGTTAATAFAIGSMAATAAGTIQSYESSRRAADDSRSAANSAAATVQATADYNARVDQADEAQVALDSAANVREMRRDAATYMSRQKAAFAGAGVSVDSGSPLAVRVATAARLALMQQQAHTDAAAKIERLESGAKAGVAEASSQADATRIEGQARADAYHRAGTAAVLSGASRMLGQAYGLYQSGGFDFGGGPGLGKLKGAVGGFDAPTWSPGMS